MAPSPGVTGRCTSRCSISLLDRDDYLLLADYRAYVDAQTEAARAFGDPGRWARMSILNAARAGKFYSDRAIREYCASIWQVRRTPTTFTP